MPAPLRPQPRVDATVLRRRVSHLRQALGAVRLGIARRLLAAPPGDSPGRLAPFEILCVADRWDDGDSKRPWKPEAGPPIPLDVVHRLMVGGGHFDLQREGPRPSSPELLERWSARRIAGWALPRDRRPVLYAVAIWGEGPDPGSRREETARLGLEALARALAPPDWLPLTAPDSGRGANGLLPLALTGSSEGAARLRRQFHRLRRSRGPVLVVGGRERGAVEVAAALTGWIGELEPLPLAALLESGCPGARPCDARGLCELSAQRQARLKDLLGAVLERGERWAFFAPEGIRDRARRSTLRPDLFWMLATRQLDLPALTERSCDLPELFREAWRRHAGRRIALSPAVDRALQELAWPGDLAQLEAEVRRLATEHPAAEHLRRSWLRRQLELDVRRDLEAESFEGTVAQVERRLLERALHLADGNKSQAARALRMSRTGFYRKLQRHGLWRPPGTRSEDDETTEPG